MWFLWLWMRISGLFSEKFSGGEILIIRKSSAGLFAYLGTIITFALFAIFL